MKRSRVRDCLPLVYVAVLLSISPIDCDYNAITLEFGAEAVDHCIKKCPFQNRTDAGQFEIGCGTECNIEQCSTGCKLWEKGLDMPCQAVCNVTAEVASHRELYCVMGCNEALNHYFQKLKDAIGSPPAPALVADSLTATSLSLEWEGSKFSNLSYLVQWRYEEVAGAWQYCRNQTWGQYSTVKVDNLQPYTKYRFRIAVLLSSRHGDPIVSQPSVVISTLPAGPPKSVPVSLRVTAIDPHRISLSWEPGQFPNGPILSYVLRISDGTPNGYSALKDIPASENTLFYMFQNLAPATAYSVAVAMRNGEGEGPRMTVEVSTPALPAVVANQQPVLILGGQHTVLQQACDMLLEPTVLYVTDDVITGIGLDLTANLLFVSELSGSVYRSSLSSQKDVRAVLTPTTIPYKPLRLSVDWLNSHLYILGEMLYHNNNKEWGGNSTFEHWQVVRCDFEGKGQTIAFAGFTSKPVHIEVDPYNGYLFWVLQGASHGGLYRLDLADISNGVKHEKMPEYILRDGHLGAFTVDHTNFRVLVSHLRRNTVLSVSLDGREVFDFRNNTQKPMFNSVQSLAFANGLFYWTNGNVILTEEYHEGQDSYFHNPYLTDTLLSTVLVALRSCQPIPVAVNPPIGVQSVMGINHAKITWQPPHLLGHQGNGAWQQWQYHLQITDVTQNFTIHRTGINSTSALTVHDLKENTQYIIKAAAFTMSGSGPWSTEFVGKTLLSQYIRRSSLLWSTKAGLFQTNLTGDNMQMLVHKDHLREGYITDISWYHDMLYLVTNASTVLWYNSTSIQNGWMANMENVGSLAVDWIGKNIYWSNPKQQLITRANLRGENREPVPIVTVAKELKIDALEGYIYWNTGHAVESARLNGENKITYYPAQFFSGKQVMGLTVDLEGKWLYWLVRGFEGSNLYKAPTAENVANGEKISGSPLFSLSGTSTLGPLCYFSERLVWLQDESNAVISDLTGNNRAILNGSNMAGVNMIAIVDPLLHSNSDQLNPIPEAIDSKSIVILGHWDTFNITWRPVQSVNHGIVFYDLNVEINKGQQIQYTVTDPYLTYNAGDLPPYSALEVSVRAYTYWGGSLVAQSQLHTPQSPPTHPTYARAFVEHTIDIFRNQQQTSAIFRWDPPTHANGIIQKYRVFKWDAEVGTDNNVKRGELLQPQVMQYVAKNLRKNVTYYFQVQACTSAGYGPLTRKISITTDLENPIPKLIISTHEAIIITDLDLGTAGTYTVARSTGRPLDFTVSMQENAIYWANELNEIFISHIDQTGYIKLTSLNGTVTTLAYDWIARMLYWCQMDTDFYTIYKMDLNYHDSETILKITSVLSRPNQIQNLQISPLTRSLYWVEPAQDGHGKKLMTSNTEGNNVQTFFGQNDESDGDCDCPDRPAIAQTYIIDFQKNNRSKLYWVDAWTNHIVVSDMKGCMCKILVNATRLRNYGLPPTSISVDSKNMFWLNSTQKRLYMTDNQLVENISHTSSSSGYKILALKSQLYPRKECLSPNQNSMLQVSMAKRTSDSINLVLPALEKHRLCKDVDVEMATPQYILHYRPYVDNDSTYSNDSLCKMIKTFEKEIHLSNLRPFTKYSFQLQVTNYYGRLQEITPTMGPTIILRTSAGAPGMAKNLNASVISPSTTLVEWQTPDYDPLSDEVWYEVHWRTGDSESSGQKLKEHNTIVAKPAKTINIPRAELQRLLPDQLYIVWVRTYSNNSDVSTDSDSVQIVTYPEPNNITLTKPTAYTLRIAWLPYKNIRVVQHYIEYAELGTDHWCLVKDKGVNKSDGSIHHLVDELVPKTQYKFRMQLQYLQNTSLYTWPQDARFTYETLGDRPSPPGRPHVQRVSLSVYQLQWAAAAPHGSAVAFYRLWGAQHIDRDGTDLKSNVTLYTENDNQVNDFDYYVESRDNVTYKEGNTLVLLYNGTDNYWIIADLQLDECYTFYVQALNSYGWSDYSEPSEVFDFTESNVLAAQQEHMSIILGVGIPVLATFAFSLLVALICLIQKRGKKKTLLDNPNTLHNAPRGLDVELATLRELPRTRGGNFQHSTNILYNNGTPHTPTDAEISMLPHIRRDQITLKKFLGSGAFGEVFEGTAKNLGSRSLETKVAIKTLRKGASEQEKTEFLQEAQLMSNFKHDHILSLLGVCLDNNPNFIIMELMEGGDLLSYLRSKRNLLYTPSSLMLTDLLSMCVDVTRGCRYLEEMHFVHRDLACRNCLVSHKDSGRIVKIGDFGLARDIYKNDYYRKEGEGLLPVRWMAVECLVDGVFSSQSDVWAWGVLCWEVLSLGHQPYPGRTNHEVLAHVRQGGTPSRPPNCSHRFYELLQRCWSYNPDHRPTFKHCLEVVQELKDKTSPNISLTATTLAEAPQYLTILRDDEDYPPEAQNMNGQFTPKYLEFLFNTEAPIAMTSDGYEIPRTTLQRHSSFRSTLPRHSIIGVNPNRLIRTPPNLLRSNSLKVQPSHKRILSSNGIVPFRNVMLRPLSLPYGDHMSGGSSTSVTDRPVYKNIIGNKNMREMTLPTPMSVVGTSDSNLSELNKLLSHNNKRSNSASDNEELSNELSQVENR